MNSPSVQAQLGTRPAEEKTLLTFLNRVALPVLGQVRKLVNGLAERSPVTVTGAVALSPFDDLILADATAGPFTIVLPSAATWIRLKIVKVDASANAVTVSARFNGNVVLAAQGDSVTLESDGNAFY